MRPFLLVLLCSVFPDPLCRPAGFCAFRGRADPVSAPRAFRKALTGTYVAAANGKLVVWEDVQRHDTVEIPLELVTRVEVAGGLHPPRQSVSGAAPSRAWGAACSWGEASA